jgi:hypothetical protein
VEHGRGVWPLTRLPALGRITGVEVLEIAVSRIPATATEPELTLTDAHNGRDIEQNIIDALGSDCLGANDIAEKAGYPNNSNFRARLAAMKDCGRLKSGPRNRGYLVNRRN